MSNLRPFLALAVLAAAGPAFAGQPSPFILQPWAPHGATSQARYGAVVAPAGDVNGDGYSDVLVSAPKDEGPAADAGKVFLYLGSKSGLATAPAWSWSANQAAGATGTSAAAAGDVNGDGYGDVVIGTPQWNAAGPVAMAGKISVFQGGPTGLPASPTYERLAPTPTANARFGFSVATAGNVNGDAYDDIVVGAPFHTTGGLTARGAAYVFLGGASGLAATPATTLLGGQAGMNFGRAVSTAGDVDGDGFADVLVGAPGAVFDAVNTGTASLFRGSGAGLAAVPDTVIGGEHPFEETGYAVANAGDVNGDGYADVLIGHPGWGNGDLNWGKYQLILGGPGGLEGPGFVITGGDAGERLGTSVATLGDINADGYADFAVGAPYDSAGTPNARVFVHMGGTSQISLQIQLVNGSGVFFGSSVATAGDLAGDGFSEFLVGDPGASVVPAAAEGTASLYRLVKSVPVQMDGAPIFSGENGTLRGAAVAIAPGLDVSGFARVAAGEPGYDGGGTDTGILYTYAGSSAGMTFAGFTSQLGELPGDQFGARLADAGDIDRDGYTDLLISSPTHNGAAGTEAGRVSLMRGAQTGVLAPVSVLEGPQALARVGSAISGRGDIDGDGYHDVVIGAPLWDGPGLPDCGKAWVLYGGPAGFRAGVWTTQGTAAGQGLGASVAIGDVDADGYGDVLIGSVSPLSVSPPPGKVEVHYGGAGGASASAAWEITSSVPSPSFGTALSAVGDIDDDAVCDIAVGAPDEGGTGRVYDFRGGRGRGKPPAPHYLAGTQAGGRFGATIAGGGDVDGDGIGDMVVGEPFFIGDQPGEGRVYLYYGQRANDPQLGWVSQINNANVHLGSSLATLNDLNNDGFADIAAGAPGQVGVSSGVFVFAGGGGLGVTRSLPLQKDLSSNPYLYRPVRIGAGETAAVSTGLRSAEGRGRVRFQVEAIPTAQPFTGTPTYVSPPIDTGTPGNSGSTAGVFSQLDLPWMGVTYKVRARSRSSSPFFPNSRWLRPESHASGDYDVYRGGVEVGVADSHTAAAAPHIASIAPNPMPSVDGARIAYDLPRPARVVLDLYDVRGARVRRLVDEAQPAGASTATWDGRDDDGRAAPAGLYFVRMTADGAEDRGRLVRLRR